MVLVALNNQLKFKCITKKFTRDLNIQQNINTFLVKLVTHFLNANVNKNVLT